LRWRPRQTPFGIDREILRFAPLQLRTDGETIHGFVGLALIRCEHLRLCAFDAAASERLARFLEDEALRLERTASLLTRARARLREEARSPDAPSSASLRMQHAHRIDSHRHPRRAAEGGEGHREHRAGRAGQDHRVGRRNLVEDARHRERPAFVRVKAFGERAGLLDGIDKRDHVSVADTIVLDVWIGRHGNTRESWEIYADAVSREAFPPMAELIQQERAGRQAQRRRRLGRRRGCGSQRALERRPGPQDESGTAPDPNKLTDDDSPSDRRPRAAEPDAK